jgi:hypothetical protein
MLWYSSPMRIIRVFPRQTNCTPDDPLAAVRRFPNMVDQADEIHVSVSWSWDIPFACELEKQWKHVAPVMIGGPAIGTMGYDFTPGMYLKSGYVITSRGCPNRCWFCSVWKRDGDTRELPITDGWNVLDDNLLACSDAHIKAVFAMLARQKRKPEFTGGLEAKRLRAWHVAELKNLKSKQLFFAYDTPDDLEPLREAGKLLLAGGFTTASHALRCYVLCGWKGDTEEKATARMNETIDAGFTPMAMAMADERGNVTPQWRAFRRRWIRCAIIYANNKPTNRKANE